MQILLNENEVKVAIADYIQGLVTVNGEQAIQVELTDEGATVFILNPDEPAGETSPAPTGERPPKKSRRTKAQIEADNKAEAERLANAQADAAAGGNAGNDASSTETPAAETTAVQAEAVGETTQEPLARGEKDPSLDTPLVVEQPAEEPAADPVGGEIPAETPATVETQPPAEEGNERPKKPSLFANLRKPNNAAP